MLNSILVQDVVKGMYLLGLGVVSEVHIYHSEKFVPDNQRPPMSKVKGHVHFSDRPRVERVINEQVEAAYVDEPDQVVIECGIRKYRYKFGDSVKGQQMKLAA